MKRIAIATIIASLCCLAQPCSGKTTEFKFCKNICTNGSFALRYQNNSTELQSPVCICKMREDLDAAEAERMQKMARNLNIQLQIVKLPSVYPDERSRNRVIKRRQISEKTGNIIKLLSITTPSDVDNVATTNVKLSDMKENVEKKAKVFFERAQERIKKLKEANMILAKEYAKNRHQTNTASPTTLREQEETNKIIGNPFPSALSSAPFPFLFTKKWQHKRQTNLFGARDGLIQFGQPDSTLLRPIDFVPAPVRQFVPNVIPDVVMGKPPLAQPSSRNNGDMTAEQPIPKPLSQSSAQGAFFLPQIPIPRFQIAAAPFAAPL